MRRLRTDKHHAVCNRQSLACHTPVLLAGGAGIVRDGAQDDRLAGRTGSADEGERRGDRPVYRLVVGHIDRAACDLVHGVPAEEWLAIPYGLGASPYTQDAHTPT